MVELSVVIPVYGCRDCLSALHARLTAVLAPLVGSFEVIFVDDRGEDGSWEVLEGIARDDDRVRLVRLSRNFGQHRAITAGLAETQGRWVVVTDCDLEDPPEEIERLYAKALEGHDFVLSRRRQRRQTWFRRFGARAYRRMANALSGTEMDPEYTNLSIVSRQVVDEFLRFRDQDRQYLMILLWLGFDHATIEVDQDDRFAGGSSYTLGELLKVAADGIFFQTTKLLRWIVYAGFVIALLGVVLALLLVYSSTQNNPPQGWTSLAVVLLILAGFIIATTGVTGLYVGKIFNQVKGRPLYVVERRVGGQGSEFDPAERDPAMSEPLLELEPAASPDIN